ncbi:MAG: hypothetical protein IJK98_02655 [Clostridia bacterium]|nr:hypothetical protein [Clostridia bacterium]
MLTFFKLLFKGLEVWRTIAEATLMAESVLDTIDALKAKIEEVFPELSESLE